MSRFLPLQRESAAGKGTVYNSDMDIERERFTPRLKFNKRFSSGYRLMQYLILLHVQGLLSNKMK
jgi:hypothetical protein